MPPRKKRPPTKTSGLEIDALVRTDHTCPISVCLCGFGDEERSLILLIAGRVREGQGRYGRFSIARDHRNMLSEALEEVADALVYSGVELVRAWGHKK